jgi:hypothetical protein
MFLLIGLLCASFATAFGTREIPKTTESKIMDKLVPQLYSCIQERALEPHFCRVLVKAHLKRICNLPDFGPESNECFNNLESILENEVENLKNKNN